MSTMFSQQILSDKLLLAITDWQKSNFNDEFKLEQVTIFLFFLIIKNLVGGDQCGNPT